MDPPAAQWGLSVVSAILVSPGMAHGCPDEAHCPPGNIRDLSEKVQARPRADACPMLKDLSSVIAIICPFIHSTGSVRPGYAEVKEERTAE